MQLSSFVDTTLLILGEQHFLLDSKQSEKSRTSQPTACCVGVGGADGVAYAGFKAAF